MNGEQFVWCSALLIRGKLDRERTAPSNLEQAYITLSV